MRYTEAVAEARRLTKRSEQDQWRLAELTWEQIESGKSGAQWARDIGVDASHANRLYRIWDKWINEDVTLRPPFAEAYTWSIGDRRVAEIEEHGSLYAANARRAIRNLPPEKKAEVIEELLAEPEARRAAGRVLDKHYDEARARERHRDEPYRTPQSTPDFAIEVLVRLRAISAAIKNATDLILSGPQLDDAADLVAVVDWQTNALTIVRAALAGRSDLDAELAEILREG